VSGTAAILGLGVVWCIYLKALSLTNAYPLFSALIYLSVSGAAPSA